MYKRQHLHGYSEADRRIGLADAVGLIDNLRDAGHNPSFVDLGGGVPMSYLDDAREWADFRRALERQRESSELRQREGADLQQREGSDLQHVNGGGMQHTGDKAFTWKRDPLVNTYPFHQSPVRGEWLTQLLSRELPDYGITAEVLRDKGIALHMEPGRSILDGGGVILAEVAFVKERSDGLPLVGLAMNRTQCRTTSDDILLDPILVPAGDLNTGGTPEEPGSDDSLSRINAGLEAFLVGAYCIEDEVIIRRRMVFPDGVVPGDIVAIPNTAGYFMHILESASHQIPLARNLVRVAREGREEPSPQVAQAGVGDEVEGGVPKNEGAPSSGVGDLDRVGGGASDRGTREFKGTLEFAVDDIERWSPLH